MYQIASTSSASSSSDYDCLPNNEPWQTPYSQYFEDFESLQDLQDPTFMLGLSATQHVEPTVIEPTVIEPTLIEPVESVPVTPTETYAPQQSFQRPTRRVRGRPRGNPPKLNLEQRRQRNAELERERRAEMSDAYNHLLNSVSGLSEDEAKETLTDELSRAKLLEKAIHMIKFRPPPDEIATIKLQNENLMRQIEMLEARMLEEVQ